MKKCKNYVNCKNFTNNNKFCSIKCYHLSNIWKKAIKKSHETQRRKKVGFWNFSVQSMGGKIGCKKANKTNRRNKTGFSNPKVQSKAGKIGGKKTYENKSGIYTISKKRRKEISEKAAETNKRKGTGFFDHKVRSLAIASNRKRKFQSHKLKFKSVIFDSRFECEIAMCLYYQKFIKKLIERKNCHVIVGCKEHDFLFNKQCIEVHSLNNWTNKKFKEAKNYDKKRRKNLNENGYKDYNLIVIK